MPTLYKIYAALCSLGEVEVEEGINSTELNKF